MQAYYNDDVIVDGDNITFGMWAKQLSDMSTKTKMFKVTTGSSLTARKSLFWWLVLDESVAFGTKTGRPGWSDDSQKRFYSNAPVTIRGAPVVHPMPLSRSAHEQQRQRHNVVRFHPAGHALLQFVDQNRGHLRFSTFVASRSLWTRSIALPAIRRAGAC